MAIPFQIWRLFHFRFEVMVNHRYFVLSGIQSTWPWSLYKGGYILNLPLGRPTLIVESLPTLNSINQVSSHLAILSRSIWSRLMLFLLVTCLYKIQSLSANSRTVLWVTPSGRSFIWIRKRIGHRTEPWGTPDKTGPGSDSAPSRTTLWVRSARKHLIQSRVPLLIPYHSSLYRSLRDLWHLIKSLAEIHHYQICFGRHTG